jgi:hypothetical protein
MKRIVVIPCFGEAHFTALQIDNLIDTVKPTHIIYNEGLFPKGPENKGIDPAFRTDFCYRDTNLAWDTEVLQQAILAAQSKYPDVSIKWNPMDYSDIDANDCYVHSVSTLGVDVEEGDLIFPLEGDVFFHEDDMQLLHQYIDALQPDQGLQAPYLDFMENQYYIEAESLHPERIHKRRIVIKFGSWEYYREVVKNFTSQKYPQLEIFPRYIFHYAWWRPGKYKELRFRQLVRPETYSAAFRTALQQASENRLDNIVIRPTRAEDDPLRYITKIDIKHPVHILQHSNYI